MWHTRVDCGEGHAYHGKDFPLLPSSLLVAAAACARRMDKCEVTRRLNSLSSSSSARRTNPGSTRTTPVDPATPSACGHAVRNIPRSHGSHGDNKGGVGCSAGYCPHYHLQLRHVALGQFGPLDMDRVAPRPWARQLLTTHSTV